LCDPAVDSEHFIIYAELESAFRSVGALEVTELGCSRGGSL